MGNSRYKFRAWDNVENKMIYLGEDNDYSFEVSSTGFRCTKLGTNPFDYEILEHLNYQQFTGLKDRNGKEIYEGDIVKSYCKNGGWEIDTVEFKSGRFILHDKDGILSDIWLDDEELEKLEVIGNIFEHPDLLEEKHE